MPKKKYEIPFLNEWIETLESGKYKQGRQSLRTADDGFCCLGVYCDILSKKGLGEWSHDGHAWKFTFRDEGEEGTLPSTVVGLGFQQACGFAYNAGTAGSRTLADANDGGRPFKEIARIIRNNCVEKPTHIGEDGSVYMIQKL